jgi:serine/threonine protein kinase
VHCWATYDATVCAHEYMNLGGRHMHGAAACGGEESKLAHFCHLQVIGQVLKAVHVLHAQGYAHRNIKPSNILRRLKQHDWVLSDFGCAASLGMPLPLPRPFSSSAALFRAPALCNTVACCSSMQPL